MYQQYVCIKENMVSLHCQKWSPRHLFFFISYLHIFWHYENMILFSLKTSQLTSKSRPFNASLLQKALEKDEVLCSQTMGLSGTTLATLVKRSFCSFSGHTVTRTQKTWFLVSFDILPTPSCRKMVVKKYNAVKINFLRNFKMGHVIKW